MMMIYALYFHRVSPMCTPMYEFTCYHCVLYAITPLISLLSSSPSAAHPPGQRHPCAPRRHCSTGKHRRMIACGGLRRRLRAAAGCLRQRLRRAPPAGNPAPPAAPEAGGLGRCLRMAVSGGACGGPASLRTVRRRPVSLLTVRRGRRLRRAGPVAPAG